MAANDQERCGQCGARLVPIAYGFPGPDALEKERAGELLLGGCTIEAGQPRRGCPGCDRPGSNYGGSPVSPGQRRPEKGRETWKDWLAVHQPVLEGQKTPFEMRFAETVLTKVSGLRPSSVLSQVPFKGPDGQQYYMDFAIQEPGGLKIAIEVDGWDKRATGTGMTRQEFSDFLKRQTALSAQGWMVLRFANGYFTRHPDLCIRQIELALRTARAALNAVPVPSQAEAQELTRLRGETNDVAALRREVDVAAARADTAERQALSARADAAQALRRRNVAVSFAAAGAILIAGATFMVSRGGDDPSGTVPVGSACPESAPVKGSRNMIFHLPGGKHYDATTRPVRCFEDAAEAVAAGYQASENG